MESEFASNGSARTETHPVSRSFVILLAVSCWIGVVLAASDARAADRLKKQDIYPVGLWIGPSLPWHDGEREVRAAEAHIFRLAATGAQALMCEYEVIDGSSKSYVHVNLWYHSVGASQRELMAVSRGHPMALLGDKAFEACPSRMAATNHAQASLQRFRKMAAGIDPDDPTPLPPPLPAPGKFVDCAVIQDYPVESQFLLVNGCSFAVNIKYCGSSPGVAKPRRPCLPGILQHINPKQRILLTLPLSSRVHWRACRHPEVPVSTWMRDPKGYRWTCELPPDQ